MAIKKHILYLGFIITLLLQGCAGTRYSYRPLLDNKTNFPTIHIVAGEKKEVLAVGDGFPGRFGWYPAILTKAPDIASIHCENKRSFIPFREPGVVFGGAVCYLTAPDLAVK